MVDHERLDVEDLIDETWPKHGPYGEYQTRNAINALYELVRYLNYATQYREGVPYPSVAGSIAGGVGSAAGALDQALEQLTNQVGKFAADPNLYGDDKRDPAEAHESGVQHAELAMVKLAQARRDAHQLHRTLVEAGSHLHRLGLRD